VQDHGLPPDLFAGTVELLAELAAISSPSGDADGLRRMAERLAAELGKRGLSAEVRWGAEGASPGSQAPAAGNSEGGVAGGEAPPGSLPVLVARGADLSRGHLLLLGHLDTVLPALPPRREDGRLIATGAIDMKGGLATLLGALDLLARRGVEPPRDLLVVAVPDEEVAGELSRAAVASWGAAARGLWVLEPGEPGSAAGAETLVGGRRGMFGWQLAARGRAAHSGLHYTEGRSALLAAARWCIEAAAGSGAPGAPTVNPGRLVAGDATFVDALATAHARLGTDRQLNVIPDRAVAEGEARFLRAAEGEELARRLASLAAEIGAATGTTLAFGRGSAIPPVEPHAAQRARCARAVALAAARGWRLEIEMERGGISFPNFLPVPNRIPVLDGLGPIGGGMHTRDEWVDLRSLERRVVLLADLLEEDNRGG
jgi:glutamate carboxypeptidase